ncbi:Asp23/Gls24 family envelope stress response protein [Streptomyces sp. ME01-24h]|nr:Asp23/Gls24 family envelope stress response protein [Streptomyces sp. ME19-03-3]MDX3356944.1 Asp23/Gls24 family envelope stress response protein [Streptomyces sp. ME01-24h]
MTDTTDRPLTGQNGSTGAGTTLKGPTGPDTSPETRGKTTIADGVVAKIAGTAAREVPGIHNLGAGMARAMGAMRGRVPGGGTGSVSRGVKCEVGESQAALDLDVVVDYGYAIPDVAAEVRVSVISAVERMTGLEVVEVNLVVDDVNLPDEEDESEPAEGRVQ